MPSIFDSFVNNLRRDLEKSASELLRDINRESAKRVREMLKEARRVNRLPVEAVEPVSRGKKRAPHGPRDKTDELDTPRVWDPVRITLYEILEVSTKASPETISAAFRSLSKKHHPDNYSHTTGSSKAEERYKQITAAWTVLKDVEKRKRYDRSLGLG